MSVDIKVRGYHLDIYNHVNNGRYLEFLEEGRWDYFDRHQFVQMFEAQSLAFVIANININYCRPAYAGETIRVITRMDRVGTKSAVMKQQVHLLVDGEVRDLVVDADITFCLMDHRSQKAIVLEGEARQVIERMIEEGL